MARKELSAKEYIARFYKEGIQEWKRRTGLRIWHVINTECLGKNVVLGKKLKKYTKEIWEPTEKKVYGQ